MNDDEIKNTFLTGNYFKNDRSRTDVKKTLEQKIAGAQNKLNYLKAKEKRETKQEKTRQNNSWYRSCQGIEL
ncbi:Uncharacterised protein [Klebsiella pneumoniae]|nr:Uncharacterised protein [Klebsiella pneumoniae]